MNILDQIQFAADAIYDADTLLIGAGAGMGVDSGLPDFRGDEGFWRAYPMLHGRPFTEMANPRWFEVKPTLAWGFYGHRLNLYRETVPHEGFHILRRLMESKPMNGFIYTSNVDGQFQKAGFAEDVIYECHGSIHYLQCTEDCSKKGGWNADRIQVEVDDSILTAVGDLPKCPDYGDVARPNILMFDDANWNMNRSKRQKQKFQTWYERARGNRIVAIELGAGTAIPSVRWTCESHGNQLIRINPRESQGPEGTISISLGALEALKMIEEEIF